MKRREFTAGLAAPARLAPSPSSAQTPIWHPRLLIAPADPFTGLTLLKSRYASGPRPSEDMEGWALSWRLTGQDTFAERALAERRTKPSAGKSPSRSWLDFTRWSLGFDWLVGHRGFEGALQARVAHELMEGTAAMLTTAGLPPSFKKPGCCME